MSRTVSSILTAVALGASLGIVAGVHLPAWAVESLVVVSLVVAGSAAGGIFGALVDDEHPGGDRNRLRNRRLTTDEE